MSIRSNIHILLLTVLVFASIPNTGMAYTGYSPYTPYSAYPYRKLPNALDIMESGLYWMRDWTGVENVNDPASIVSLMEQQAARYFDFGKIAEQVGGPY